MGPCFGRRAPRYDRIDCRFLCILNLREHVAAYQKTYGSLDAVAVLTTWLWVAAYFILAGAELNAQIGRGLTQR
ncbi:YhjD/YihY/BrkB family envelope integrity protein [Bradyrhizobium lupini]|jgi:uncharacterized BrkB/YihY/UPF0761 family membrane protein|uniref:YhjD/YihY/BrkB family envelope integrity protein n=1 Tax=Rhizobium lupini TaxID=136996 RepID=UPI0034C5E4D5